MILNLRQQRLTVHRLPLRACEKMISTAFYFAINKLFLLMFSGEISRLFHRRNGVFAATLDN